MKPSFDNA